MVIIDIIDMLNIAGNISNLDKDYDCGHEETFKYYAFKNISYEFYNNASLMSAEIINKVSKMLSKARLIKHKCINKNLEYANLSVKRQESKFHLGLVTTSSVFPSLRVFNLSDNLMSNLAEAFRKWYWHYPKLEIIDLSHKYFTELEFDPSADAWDGVPVQKMNMSYNNVSELKGADKYEEIVY